MSGIVGKENKQLITLPIMTIYEKAVIIKKRVKQLDGGYKSTIEDTIKEKGIIGSYNIAMEEFKQRKIPNSETIRKIGDGTYEIWEIEDFDFRPDEDVFQILN
jgi:DNA-directed RNA polymerase subunit K/omega